MSIYGKLMNQMVTAIKDKNPNVCGRLNLGQMVTGVESIPIRTIASGTFFKCIYSNGVTWNGVELLQDSEGNWSEGQKVASDMTIVGFTPQIGEIYSADTTIWVREAFAAQPGKMVCLVHFESSASTFVDATRTCVVQIQPQAESGVLSNDSETVSYGRAPAKFGNCSFFYNYYQPYFPNGGISFIGLPELDAFTIEFWHYHRGWQPNFTGPCLVVPQSGNAPRIEVAGYAFDSNLYKNRWVHRAWVRGQGSNVVREYWDGAEVATYSCEGIIGGDRVLYVFGGGTIGVDTKDQLDELAIFNYAKYTGVAYDVPTRAYSDIPSGLHQENPTRAVSVSGCSIDFVNDKSYDYVGTDEDLPTLMTADEKWKIWYDPMNSNYWIISNNEEPFSEGFVMAAYMDQSIMTEEDLQDQGAINPVGCPYWIDNITKQPITVTAN